MSYNPFHAIYFPAYSVLCESLKKNIEKENELFAERNIPKSPIKKLEYSCPSCGKAMEKEYNFCHNCGQKLDWSNYKS